MSRTHFFIDNGSIYQCRECSAAVRGRQELNKPALAGCRFAAVASRQPHFVSKQGRRDAGGTYRRRPACLVFYLNAPGGRVPPNRRVRSPGLQFYAAVIFAFICVHPDSAKLAERRRFAVWVSNPWKSCRIMQSRIARVAKRMQSVRLNNPVIHYSNIPFFQ